jgi:hypothetical protein
VDAEGHQRPADGGADASAIKIVGQRSKNPELNEWSTNQVDRLPGLKFMRTRWLCDVVAYLTGRRRSITSRRR